MLISTVSFCIAFMYRMHGVILLFCWSGLQRGSTDRNTLSSRYYTREIKQPRATTTTMTMLKKLFFEQKTALHLQKAFWYISLTSTARLRRETS